MGGIPEVERPRPPNLGRKPRRGFDASGDVISTETGLCLRGFPH